MITFIRPTTLKQLIKESKYTQTEIAKLLGMSRQVLATQLDKDENDLTINQINNISNILGWKVDIKLVQA